VAADGAENDLLDVGEGERETGEAALELVDGEGAVDLCGRASIMVRGRSVKGGGWVLDGARLKVGGNQQYRTNVSGEKDEDEEGRAGGGRGIFFFFISSPQLQERYKVSAMFVSFKIGL
jgi:hypothetical protein